MANREEGAAVPNQRQWQEQPHHQDAVRQRHIHLNWSNFKTRIFRKTGRRCRGTFAMIK